MSPKHQSSSFEDLGESLPLDAALYDGDAREYHNRYPEEWAKVNQEAIDEAGCSDEIMYFMRAGFTFSPQYTSLFWLGDQVSCAILRMNNEHT